jgi:hypothetical protein
MKTIIRIAKLKTGGNIGSSAKHNYRERQTDNADPKRTVKNQNLGCTSAAELLAAVQSKIDTVPNLRKDSVRCIEYLITASPQFFEKKDGSQSTRGQYFNDSLKWLEAKHGKENIVATSLHLDEKTPHLVAYVVPIDKSGRLNAKSFTGGRELLRGMQTDFANSVGAKHGLERGIEGSKSRHESIKSYYERVNSPTPQTPSMTDLVFSNKKIDDFKKVYAQNLERQKELRKKEDEIKRYQSKIENQRDEIKMQNIELRQKTDEMKFHQDNEKKLSLAVASLIKKSYSPSEFVQHMGVQLKGKADIFDALLREGRAKSFVEAVELVAKTMPSKQNVDWVELAKANVDDKKAAQTQVLNRSPQRSPSM